MVIMAVVLERSWFQVGLHSEGVGIDKEEKQ